MKKFASIVNTRVGALKNKKFEFFHGDQKNYPAPIKKSLVTMHVYLFHSTLISAHSTIRSQIRAPARAIFKSGWDLNSSPSPKLLDAPYSFSCLCVSLFSTNNQCLGCGNLSSSPLDFSIIS